MTSTPELSRLPRPASDERFAALEGWRGIACLAVLVYHCGFSLQRAPFACYGLCGVHMFFVLSGYLLFRPFATAFSAGGPLPNAANFYLRRLIRILPPYLVSLLAFVALRVVTHVNVPHAASVLEHATLTFNLDPRAEFFGINPVYWSLAVEVQFYLLLPILCVVAARATGSGGRTGVAALWACVAAAAAVGVAARAGEVRWLGGYYAAVGNADHVRYRSMPAYLDLFAVGMAVAAVTADRAGRVAVACRARSARLLLAAAGAVVFVVANDWCAVAAGGSWQSRGSDAFLTWFPLVLAAGIGLLLLAVVTHPAGGPTWLRWRPLVAAGVVSYSLYLYHVGVQFFVFKLNLFHAWPFMAMAAANAVLSAGPALVVAVVMYRLVERPALRIVDRVRHRRRRPSAGDPLATVPVSPVSSAPLVELLGP